MGSGQGGVGDGAGGLFGERRGLAGGGVGLPEGALHGAPVVSARWARYDASLAHCSTNVPIGQMREAPGPGRGAVPAEECFRVMPVYETARCMLPGQYTPAE